MQERHKNRQQYFDEQCITTKKYVIPYIEEFMPITAETSVLEIGCGEGGNLMPFLDMGCKRVVGVDLSEGKIANANNFFADHHHKENIEFILEDIYNIEDLGQFDIIISRDVLEHIHGQERFMNFTKKFLKPKGKFFLAFPPWYNPFGGHQQVCKSKFLSKLPFFHILPVPIYSLILKVFGEIPAKIEELLEIKETGITIERCEKILRTTGYRQDKKTFYFINPNYEVKFGLKPKEQCKIFASIPYLRNFLVTAVYYLVSLEDDK